MEDVPEFVVCLHNALTHRPSSVILPGQHKQQEADQQVGGQHVDPDLEGQRCQEGEQMRVLLQRPLEQDADAEIHVGLREVDDLFSYVADGQRSDGQVSLLKGQVIERG